MTILWQVVFTVQVYQLPSQWQDDLLEFFRRTPLTLQGLDRRCRENVCQLLMIDCVKQAEYVEMTKLRECGQFRYVLWTVENVFLRRYVN